MEPKKYRLIPTPIVHNGQILHINHEKEKYEVLNEEGIIITEDLIVLVEENVDPRNC